MKEEFDAYRKKKLSASENTRFEEQLKNDPEFLEEYQRYLLGIEAIELSAIKQAINDANEDQKASRIRVSKTIRMAYRSMAAVLILAFTFSAYWVLTLNNETLLNLGPDYRQEISRGELVNLNVYESLFAKRDFEAILKNAKKDEQLDSKKSFIIAIAHYELGNYRDFLETNKMIKSNELAVSQREVLPYYEVKSLIGLKNYEEALNKINLMENEHNPYAKIFTFSYKLKVWILSIKDK